MSEEEKQALEIFTEEVESAKHYEEIDAFEKYVLKNHIIILNLIKRLKKENEEKDKIINSMTDYIINLIEYNNPGEKRDKEEIKQHFETQIKKKEMRNNRICFL